MAGEAFRRREHRRIRRRARARSRAAGGWAELQVKPRPAFSIQAGAGVDEIRGAARSVVARASRNQSAYGNVIFAVTPEIETSLEYRWLSHDAERRRRTAQSSFRLGLRLQILT